MKLVGNSEVLEIQVNLVGNSEVWEGTVKSRRQQCSLLYCGREKKPSGQEKTVNLSETVTSVKEQ